MPMPQRSIFPDDTDLQHCMLSISQTSDTLPGMSAMKRIFIIIHTIAIFGLSSLLADQPDATNTAACPAEAIFDSDPSHLWNRVHQAFFTRPDAGSDGLEPDAVDPPLWPDTSTFLKIGSSYETAIAVLDDFLTNDGHTLISDPLKRAVMQHDLWSVFDWSANSQSAESDNGSANRNLAKLRSMLADAIRQLALTTDEIASLPDNLADTVSAGSFRPAYDPEHPREPFLPPNLLDPDSPWVCVRGALDGPSAPVHVDYYQGRSPFLVFLQLPGGLQATLNYLSALNQATSNIEKQENSKLPQFPVGTQAALLRQMSVIDNRGQIQVTPLTQTLQMRVYRTVGDDVTDHENSQTAVKFRVKRSNLFSEGGGGLVPIDWSEPLRVSLLQRDDRYDSKASVSGIKTTMQSCIACHSCGGATVHSIFTYKQDDWVPAANMIAPNRLRLIATNPSSEANKTLDWKKKRYEWGLLKGLLERR